MATDNTGNNEWSWSSWLSSAKEKSLDALNATTRDLAEFVSVVQGDTTNAVSDAATKVKQIINQDQDAKEKEDIISSNKDESTDGQTSGKVTDTFDTYDRSQTTLELMRSDPNTYCSVPEGKSADFLGWSKNFDLATQQEEISRLLVASTSVRKLHSSLVPAKVSYESFWYNYFYRIYLMDKTEAHRAEIMARVHSQGQLICWDDDEPLEENRDEVNVIMVKRETASITDNRAMTDSSESFVCINEDGMDSTNPDPIIVGDDGPVIKAENLDVDSVSEVDHTKQNAPDPSKETDNDEDDGWEKWSDN